MMPGMTRSLGLVLLAALLFAAPTRAGDEKPPKTLEDRVSETKHSVVVGGRTLRYTVRAGTLVMRTEGGEDRAEIFYVAYSLDGVRDPAKRPVTFSFNGGPGSSSVWLHLGLLGPRRVELGEDGFPLPPPSRLVDNEFSLLDATDLVFIDPVLTGFSRPAPEQEKSQFHGVNEDVRSVGEFIRLWTTRNERWLSPKFLIGESYGTTRAAGLAGWLQRRHGYELNGVMLISSILDFQTARFDDGNDLPYPLFLPTYTATAWYHGKLEPRLQADLRETLDEVEAFALGDYASALLQGNRLPAAARTRVVERLAAYTGLSREYVEAANLRPAIFRFTKELRRSEGLTVGRLDSRYTGRDRDSASDTYEYDPSYAAIQGPYTGAMNAYVSGELGFESDLPYEILSGRVRPWSYEPYENRYVNVAETLRGAMTRNPALRVFVANGYYDLATPYFATEHTFAHLGLPAELEDHVSMAWYEAGHMMYVHRGVLARLKADLAAFVASATP